MRRFGYWFCAGVFGCILGVVWSVSWIDAASTYDFPGKYQLSAARLFWSITPAIDKNADAARALKFSWLKVSTEINRKEKKKISNVVGVLGSEFYFVEQLISNNKITSKEINLRAAAQLLTYLNRFELYQAYTNAALEEKLKEFSSEISTADPATQENWYREVMIRSYLKGNIDAYKASKGELVNLFEKHGQDLPTGFKEGVLSFYEGVLLCVAKKSADASLPLARASKNLSQHPQLTTNFLQQDLNVLLLGRGMESGTGCNDYLTNVILSGV
jgi:hypothetical protein